MSGQTPTPSQDKTSFLLKNLLKGILWLVVLIAIYYIFKKYFDFDLISILGPFYENPTVIYLIFLVSEVVFGIIPPEFFMLWGMRAGEPSIYMQNVVALASISYLSGVIGYYIGSYFHRTTFYRLLRRRFLTKFESQFQEYGGFLIIVAALTPLPFSGICMLVGAAEYQLKRFLLVALSRFLRFAVYGFIIWNTNVLN